MANQSKLKMIYNTRVKSYIKSYVVTISVTSPAFALREELSSRAWKFYEKPRRESI